MLALVYDGQLRLDPRRPDPAPADGDALLKVRQAGICSTDLEIVKGYMNFSGTLGHEFVATVQSCPPDKSLVGKRVVGEINCVCGQCDLCLRGLSNHCRDRTVLGIAGRDGAFAEYVRLPRQNLHVLPDNVDDDAAVFVEPLAAAFQVTQQLGSQLDAKTWVTVLGGGRLGLLVAQVLRNAGTRVRVVGRNPRKLALCEKWQVKSRLLADVRPRHDQDVVIDCTGSAGGFETAVAMCRPRGTLVLKSTVAEGTPLNLAPVVVDEITVLGSRCGPFRPAIRALAERAVDVTPLVSRRMKLSDGIAAMQAAAGRDALKVILTM